MKETFTEQQREIVARKMGYDGPMQMFDEYLASTPSDATKYAAITSKYVTKMAAGGVVTTDDDAIIPVDPKATKFKADETAITKDMKPKVDTATDLKKADVSKIDLSKIKTVEKPKAVKEDKITAVTSRSDVKEALRNVKAAEGKVSAGAKTKAAVGDLSKEAIAEEQTVDKQYKAPVKAGTRTTGAGEMVVAETTAPTVKAAVAQTAAPEEVVAAQGTVKANQLVQAAQIKEADMAQSKALDAQDLNVDATVVAARLNEFTVDDGTLAQAAQGDVNALSTVQGQLSSLMKSFDDGATPAWAAGAIRAANAAMASRGLGGSSMAATAVFQAAMESALPIASQDAKTFESMNMQNLNNRQQVALTNAAAQQGLSLQNLSNEQQARLTNATNAFALQSQNISNTQQTMLANTQIRAALQGQNLTNQQQAAVLNAARYAEQANLNLNNLQQAALHNSTMQVQVDIANTSNKQQTALANAQIEAAMQGKILDNKQQAAVLNAARISENANLTFNAAQTAALHNSEMMKSIGIAELNTAQATAIANAAAAASMDLANLNNRQQANVLISKAFLETDLKNLDNKQQVALIKSQAITQAILSDTSAKNAARATNAANDLEADKINATLALTASQYNASEKNKILITNSAAVNEINKFNATEKNNRQEFNATMSNQINIANAKLVADISTANTREVNAANAVNAKLATDMSASTYAQQSQTYRDLLEMSYKAGENDKDRLTQIATATITANASKTAAEIKADGESASAWGKLAFDIYKNWSL